jgi:hypothetical protein
MDDSQTEQNGNFPVVTPAKAGAQGSALRAAAGWIPAFAGMTLGCLLKSIAPALCCALRS